jgi:seryl-tRNA synthetase
MPLAGPLTQNPEHLTNKLLSDPIILEESAQLDKELTRLINQHERLKRRTNLKWKIIKLQQEAGRLEGFSLPLLRRRRTLEHHSNNSDSNSKHELKVKHIWKFTLETTL